MQMIDLSGVKDFNAARFLIYWLVATVIAILVAYNIDPQKKLVWFRQRSDNRFMVAAAGLEISAYSAFPVPRWALPLRQVFSSGQALCGRCLSL